MSGLEVAGAFVGGAVAASLAAWGVVRRAARRRKAADRRAAAAERLAEVGAMTSGLAHEIKNPLSTVALNVQLLEEGIRDLGLEGDEKRPLLNRTGAMQREVERLRGILSDFLEFAGEVKLDLKRVDLGEVVQELADFFHPQAEASRVRLRSDLGAGPLHVEADASLLKQALLNLMLNATQAMEGMKSSEGSQRELILRIARGRDEDGARTASVHIIDTGPGMTSETIEQIFRPYYTTKRAGSGLGLPTSRRLVEAHHGRLEVHSEPGRGTDFAVVLPEAP